MTQSLVVESFVVGPFEENCHILRRSDQSEIVIVDPGEEAPRLISHIEEAGWVPVAILNTHAHLDHIGAVSALQERFGIPFHLHPEDLPILEAAPHAARLYGVRVPVVPHVDRSLSHGETLELAGLSIRVRHTPGHTPGHVCFLVADVVCSGDALFRGSIGRTDLPGGDTETLFRSLANELLTLDDALKVYSGHGPVTTIGRERLHNPFLQGLPTGRAGPS